jgi:hypothetical protein
VARFAVGSQVRARPGDPDGHTRVPRYVRGHRGTELTEPVYAVRFSAADLWGHGRHSVIVELWESYLEEEPGER